MSVAGSSQHSHSRGAVDSPPYRFLLFAVLAAFVVRILVVAFTYSGFLDPQRGHWLFAFEEGKVAQSILMGHGFGNPLYGPHTGPTAWLPPVMPYLLAGIFALFGMFTKAAALATLGLESLLSALTCIPIFFMARKSFGMRTAQWAVWVWAFFPYAIYFSAGLIWNTALSTFLLTCILWMALCLQDSPRVRTWVGFGLLCGIATLTDPVVLSVVPLLGAWACYRLYKKGRRWLRPATASATVLCAVMAPWLIRNYIVFGKFVFLKDNFGSELCVGNVGNALHWWNGDVHPSGSARELGEFDRLGEMAYMAAKWAQARNYIESHPGIFLWRSVRRAIFIWTGYWSFNKKYLEQEPLDPANIPLCLGTTILALIGLRKMLARDAGKIVPYAILLLFYPLAYYITEPDLQYRHPLDPELVILVCCAIVSWRAASRETVEEQPAPERAVAARSARQNSFCHRFLGALVFSSKPPGFVAPGRMESGSHAPPTGQFGRQRVAPHPAGLAGSIG
ncbi:MAG TPA: glycosyltransferase family 39 protein [Patescibacteria group bacterium]|nr:glycosyltransferase family 39 protein [Patescibacteria group bacterium]